MWSIPLSLVQRVLQAIVQVWQPMHLLRSTTNAICFLGSAIVLSPSIDFLPGGEFSSALHILTAKGINRRMATKAGFVPRDYICMK
jgi:hypothetical protein